MIQEPRIDSSLVCILLETEKRHLGTAENVLQSANYGHFEKLTEKICEK